MGESAGEGQNQSISPKNSERLCPKAQSETEEIARTDADVWGDKKRISN